MINQIKPGDVNPQMNPHDIRNPAGFFVPRHFPNRTKLQEAVLEPLQMVVLPMTPMFSNLNPAHDRFGQ